MSPILQENGMRGRLLTVIKVNHIAIAGVLAVVVPATGPATAMAAATATERHAPALLYDYEFKDTGQTVNNSAPAGPRAPLTLRGPWKRVPDGVRFSGNTHGAESVAYGRPATGYTLNLPSSNAVGIGTRIVYYAPVRGKCFADTPNVTQIGRYAQFTKSAQAKLQLSSCATSKTQVLMQCRFAGARTPPKAPPVASTLPLINGHAYGVRCVKSPDHPNGKATITLAVTDLDHRGGRRTVTNTFSVHALGYLRTTNYISAGNKYPMPPPAHNTDQFNGTMTRVAVCTGAPAAVGRCLGAHLP
jgi:hypothetical protein